MNFEHPEDQAYFEKILLKNSNDSIENYAVLFDFRPNGEKRKQFSKIRNQIFEQLKELEGEECQLRYECCNPDSGFAVDHVIPLTTNVLNKKLRNLKPKPGKKVTSQHFGSNNIQNLVLACNACNNHKKHNFLEGEQLQRVLRLKGL